MSFLLSCLTGGGGLLGSGNRREKLTTNNNYNFLLPDDLMIEIFSFLNMIDFIKSTFVCSSWKRIALLPFPCRTLSNFKWYRRYTFDYPRLLHNYNFLQYFTTIELILTETLDHSLLNSLFSSSKLSNLYLCVVCCNTNSNTTTIGGSSSTGSSTTGIRKKVLKNSNISSLHIATPAAVLQFSKTGNDLELLFLLPKLKHLVLSKVTCWSQCDNQLLAKHVHKLESFTIHLKGSIEVSLNSLFRSIFSDNTSTTTTNSSSNLKELSIFYNFNDYRMYGSVFVDFNFSKFPKLTKLCINLKHFSEKSFNSLIENINEKSDQFEVLLLVNIPPPNTITTFTTPQHTFTNFSKLTELYLSPRGVMLICQLTTCLPSLKRMCIVQQEDEENDENNLAQPIDLSFIEMPLLTHLHLDSTSGAIGFTNCFENCKNLTYLHLSPNLLQNNLVNIDSTSNNCCNLKMLTIATCDNNSNVKLSLEKMKQISKLESLTHLCLDCDIEDSDAGYHTLLCESSSRLVNLQYLRLAKTLTSMNCFYNSNCVVNKKLESLSFWLENLNHMKLSYILSQIQLANLKRIIFYHQPISPQIIQNMKSVEHVKLKRNVVGLLGEYRDYLTSQKKVKILLIDKPFHLQEEYCCLLDVIDNRIAEFMMY